MQTRAGEQRPVYHSNAAHVRASPSVCRRGVCGNGTDAAADIISFSIPGGISHPRQALPMNTCSCVSPTLGWQIWRHCIHHGAGHGIPYLLPPTLFLPTTLPPIPPPSPIPFHPLCRHVVCYELWQTCYSSSVPGRQFLHGKFSIYHSCFMEGQLFIFPLPE